jgi:DNA phosphorothioation-associated putative methyltransferase
MAEWFWLSMKKQPPTNELPLFADAPLDYRKELEPARTAMRRRKASPIARKLVESGLLITYNVRTILDYGCGVGQDVAFYRERGFEAYGFDPHVPFGFTTQPTGTFDLVTCLFVLNVIADQGERRELCKSLVEHTKPRGLLVVATRSPQAIDSEASKKKWPSYKDGYLSSASRGTFQRGISSDEIRMLIEGSLSELKENVKTSSNDACMLALQKL